MEYLTIDRNIKHPKSLKAFGAGFVDGSLKKILPYDDAIIKSLKT